MMRPCLLAFLLAFTSPAMARHALPPRVTGAWYVGGNPQRMCHITSTPRGLTAQNENGDVSRVERRGSHRLFAADWESGIVGDIEGKQILWRNGTWWTRRVFGRKTN